MKLNLNRSKCHVLNIHKNISISSLDFKMNNINLSSTKVFKNLGILIAENGTIILITSTKLHQLYLLEF